MKYPKEYLDEIKNRLKVSTVISKTIQLKRRGKEFIGLSPFKNEKTPSFTVNDEKQFYHCFSTGEHGNIFDFIMKTQNLRFGEAVKTLANMAGMRPYTFSKQDVQREENWKIYSKIYRKFVDYFNQYLLNNQGANEARKYLKERHLTKTEVEKFKIGYASSNSEIFDFLKKEFDEKKIIETGLFYLDDKKKQYINRFRDRILFPINNISGDPIGIGGRMIKENKYSAKYINSPETEFFKKGSNLYNLDFARKFSSKIEEIFLVEGYMDVVGMSKNGINNVVANLGTSLTEKQINILNQFFNQIIISFDGDESGYKAAFRAAENAIKELKPEKKIFFLFLSDGMDPDTYINKFGKDKFLSFSEFEKISIHEFIFNHYLKDNDRSPSSLAIIEKKLRTVSNSIKDSLIKKYTLEYFLERLNEFTPNLSKGKINSPIAKSLATTKKYFNDTKSFSSVELKEFSLIYLILNHLSIFHKNYHLLQDMKIFTFENNIILQKILERLRSDEEPNLEDLKIDKKLLQNFFNFAPVRHIVINKKNDEGKIIEIFSEIQRDIKNYELELRIEELESKFSEDFSEKTFNELKELKKLKKTN